MAARRLDHYERRAVHDIRAWVAGERTGPDRVAARLSRLGTRVASPVSRALDSLMADERVAQTLDQALNSSVDALARYVTSTTPADAAAERYGVADAKGIRKAHLQDVDRELMRVREQHRLTIIGLGAAEGLAGVASPAASLLVFVAGIPALQAASLRAVADLFRHTGFDPSSPEERALVAEITLRTLEQDGRDQRELLSRALGFAPVTPMADPRHQQAVMAVLQARARRAGVHITRRRAAALLPIVGAAVGAGVNAVYAHRLLEGTTVLLRARHLARRHRLSLEDLIGDTWDA